MSISWRLVSFTQSQSTPYNIIRCNQDRFLYYLSVYVKSFKELFSYLLVRGVFLKSECKSTNYFPNTQEFRRKSLKINSYLTLGAKNKRLYCPTLIILYTRERGLRVCGRTGEGKSRFQQQKPNNLIFQYTRLRNSTHIHAVYSCSNCRKTRSQLQNHIAPTGKIFFPNWEIIFSQLSTACWRINIQKLSCHCFPDFVESS